VGSLGVIERTCVCGISVATPARGVWCLVVQTSFIPLLFFYTLKLGRVGGPAFISVTITTSSGGVLLGLLGRLVSRVAGSRPRAIDVACATAARGVDDMMRVVFLYNFGLSIVVGLFLFLLGIARGRTNVSGTTTARVNGHCRIFVSEFTATGVAIVFGAGALAGDRITRMGLRTDITNATSAS
jgi:hypothetical protein